MPNRAVASHLKDMLQGDKSLELSSLIRGDAVVFDFTADDEDAGPLDALPLPKHTRIICLYRDDVFRLPEQTGRLKAGDEVILISHRKHLDAMRERWGNKRGDENEKS